MDPCQHGRDWPRNNLPSAKHRLWSTYYQPETKGDRCRMLRHAQKRGGKIIIDRLHLGNPLSSVGHLSLPGMKQMESGGHMPKRRVPIDQNRSSYGCNIRAWALKFHGPVFGLQSNFNVWSQLLNSLEMARMPRGGNLGLSPKSTQTYGGRTSPKALAQIPRPILFKPLKNIHNPLFYTK